MSGGDGASARRSSVSDGPGDPDERVTAFSMNIIPHTLQMTNLGGHLPGARVNLEIDMLARYVERLNA